MPRFFLIAFLCTCFSGKVSAQLFYDYTGSPEMCIDQEMLRKNKIRVLTVSMYQVYRKNARKKFKHELYRTSKLIFDSTGTPLVDIDYYDGHSPDIYYHDDYFTKDDSLIYNDKQQVIIRYYTNRECKTHYWYDSSGRRIRQYVPDVYSWNRKSDKMIYTQYDHRSRITKIIVHEGVFLGTDSAQISDHQEWIYTHDSMALLNQKHVYVKSRDFQGNLLQNISFTDYYDNVNGIPVRICSPVKKDDLYYVELLINVTECEPLKW